MANFVTKKDGTRVPFDAEKINHSVVFAAMEAELSEQEANSVAQEVTPIIASSFDGIEEVSSREIREKALSELDLLAPAVAESWRRYEEGKQE